MKLTLLVCIILLPLAVFSQKTIKISGTVIRKNKPAPHYCYVTVNDTLSKYRKLYLSDVEPEANKLEEYRKLYASKAFRVSTKQDGEFDIFAQINDTLFFSDNRYITQKYAVKDLIKRKKINIVLKPELCIPYTSCNDSVPDKFYVMVGEKISIVAAPEVNYCNVFPLDGPGMDAKFRVVKRIHGNYSADTIAFRVYTHQPIPVFTKSKYVMLFVSEYCGKLYLEKYQYFDVYPTIDGRWASPGDPYRFEGQVKNRTVKAVPIKFNPSLSFPTKNRYGVSFPEIKFEDPYYWVHEDIAYPLKGAYVEDLFTVKKENTLKVRKIFK